MMMMMMMMKHIPTSLHCCHVRNFNRVGKQHLAYSDMNSKYLLLKIRLFIQKQLKGNAFHRQHPLLYVCPFPCQSSVRIYTRDQQTLCQEINSGWAGSNLWLILGNTNCTIHLVGLTYASRYLSIRSTGVSKVLRVPTSGRNKTNRIDWEFSQVWIRIWIEKRFFLSTRTFFK